VWPDDVHAFLNVPMQRRALERTLEWLTSFAPAAHAADTQQPQAGAR